MAVVRIEDPFDKFTCVEDYASGSIVGDEEEIEPTTLSGAAGFVEDGDLKAFGCFMVSPYGGESN